MHVKSIFNFLAILVLCSSPVFANECFDFKTKIVTPLRDLATLESKKIDSDSGKLESGAVWGSAMGIIDKSITEIYQQLLDLHTVKGKNLTFTKLDKIQDPNYLQRYHAVFTVKPVFFATINWEEDWGFALASGEASNPSKIVISYQKATGVENDTVHIKHLCGNIILYKLGARSTKAFVYEEAKADQRSQQDTVKGEIGTINTLKGLPSS